MMPPVRQSLEPHSSLPRHSHGEAYAAVILSGSYLEAGDGGRRAVGAGHVLVHPAFAAHADVVGAERADIVNVPLSVREGLMFAGGIVDDPEELLREIAADEASRRLAFSCRIRPAPLLDEPADALAAALAEPGFGSIGAWAQRHGINVRTLLRHFVQLYGVPPAHYRVRARALSALRDIVGGPSRLAALAHDHGYADQAHMSRAVRSLTGRPPRRWRSAALSD